MSLNYKFPKHYPKDCPPQPHEEKRGTYYRVIKKNPLDYSDFKTHFELNRPLRTIVNPCSRHALSLSSNKDNLINLFKNFPNYKKMKQHIVKLNLFGKHGVVAQTGNNIYHHDWWVPENVNPLSYCDINTIEVF